MVMANFIALRRVHEDVLMGQYNHLLYAYLLYFDL
jgi:hypothetical protein